MPRLRRAIQRPKQRCCLVPLPQSLPARSESNFCRMATTLACASGLGRGIRGGRPPPPDLRPEAGVDPPSDEVAPVLSKGLGILVRVRLEAHLRIREHDEVLCRQHKASQGRLPQAPVEPDERRAPIQLADREVGQRATHVERPKNGLVSLWWLDHIHRVLQVQLQVCFSHLLSAHGASHSKLVQLLQHLRIRCLECEAGEDLSIKRARHLPRRPHQQRPHTLGAVVVRAGCLHRSLQHIATEGAQKIVRNALGIVVDVPLRPAKAAREFAALATVAATRAVAAVHPAALGALVQVNAPEIQGSNAILLKRLPHRHHRGLTCFAQRGAANIAAAAATWCPGRRRLSRTFRVRAGSHALSAAL
mmetsp:Transcript_39835/g.127653  ORF Transcript_39835/g.127653 Transcript_39835/m.127653 type:complete len:362 (+) Transcript_39835:982-2067(+)